MEDKEIIQLLGSRPSEGLQEAIRKYGSLLQVVVSRIVRNSHQDVEECVADAFVNAWTYISWMPAGA